MPNHGSSRSIVHLFSRLRTSNATTVAAVFPVLIKACGAGAAPVHALVLKSGFISSCYVRNAVLNFYAQYGPVESARVLFDEMRHRTIVDWNAMLSGYWRWGRIEEAHWVFDEMPERNVVSRTAMVSGLSRIGELEEARRVFELMPVKNVVSWNAMLSGYAQKGMSEECLCLFDEMLSSQVQPNETTWVAVITACSSKGDYKCAESLVQCLEQNRVNMNCFVKTALIDMYAKCGSLAKAKEVFDEMEVKNLVTCNTMVAAYTREGDLQAAKELFDRMQTKDVVSWNSMISGYAQHGRWAQAIDLFKNMCKTNDVKPDEFTTSSVISACGHLGILEFGRWVVDYIAKKQISLSLSGYNSLIFMYARCGSLEDAKKAFDEMPHRDIFSYNSLISGLAANGDGSEVLELLTKMKGVGIEPDSITYIGVLTACSHAGLLDEGFRIFETIKNPTVDHYACMVDLFGRAGRLDAASRIIEEMPMKPHSGVYGALLNASRIHKHIDLGEFAAKELLQLEPENSGNYILLSNIYASDGRWQDVKNLRKKMRERGVEKTIGCSWIEFGGQVHRFIAGDKLHYRAEEIYNVLEEVGKKIRVLGYIADKNCVLRDVEDEEKEEMVRTHSEKLAVGFAMLVMEVGAVIRVVKNLRICEDCHLFMKMVSMSEGREILVRDNNRFHCFRYGWCSCNDYW